MKGLQLRSLTGELSRVVPAHDKKPSATVLGIKEKLLDPGKRYLSACFGDDFDFQKDYYKLPLRAFARFSFDDLCKLNYSSVLSMTESVYKLFQKDARYEVIRKIESSMWRWGLEKGRWNEIVDAYEGIRSFSFSDDPDFEVRLDYTNWYNDFGFSKYSRTYLDGVFAFLVYYRKKHVMTIGFSIMANRGLLIQQVQLASRTGNRFLYRFPPNRLEFVISLFRKYFPNHTLYVVDGDCLVEKTLANYSRSLERASEYCERRKIELKNSTDDSNVLLNSVKKSEEECRAFQEKISHLNSDKDRLVRFYRDAGSYSLSSVPFEVNRVLHYQVDFRKSSRIKKLVRNITVRLRH